VTKKDFEDYEALVLEPMASSYRGFDIWTTPAPTSGPALLFAFNVLDGYSPTDSLIMKQRYRQVRDYAYLTP
jgi:gamma-glutamyltranspeptidase